MTLTLTFPPSAPPAELAWSKVKLGGLGYNTAILHAPDGSWSLVSTDVGGWYTRGSGDPAWTQAVQTASFPSALADPENFTTSAGNIPGCWAIAMAGDSATAYAVFRAKVLKTINKGADWTETNFAIVGGGSNDLPPNQQSFERLVANKMVVDPADPNTVILGSPTTGAYRTTDGGTTWTQPTGLPDVSSQTAGNRIYLFACDLGSTVGSGRVWFCYAYGFGLYRSTDNGATWTSAGTGFDTYLNAYDLQYRSPGVVWVVDSVATEKNIRIWTQGTGYTSITTTPASFKVRYISINPANTSDMVASAGGSSGQFTRSVDGGATWTTAWGVGQLKSQHTETRIMSYTQDQDGAGTFSWSFTKPVYHPTNGKLYWPTGYGTCWNDVSATAFNAPNSSDKVVINDFAAGMEELVAQFGIILPDHSMMPVSQDKCLLTVTDPTTYALPAFPAGAALNAGYYADYVEGTPSKIAYAVGSNLSGYSDDGGATGNVFSTNPLAGIGGGSILRFDDTHFLRFFGQNRRPRYTEDKGVTWTVPTFTGGTLPADGTTNGFGGGLTDFLNRCVAKDRDNAGVVYCVNYGEGGSNTMRGCWKSADYGATWAHQNTTLILASGQQGGHMTLIHADGVLYYTAGSTGSGYVQETTTNFLYRSINEGVDWEAITTANGYTNQVTEALQICYGAPASGSSFKTIWIVGWVDHVLGIWYSADKGQSWTKLSDYPNFDNPTYIAADPVTFGRLLLGGNGTGHSIRA